MSLPQTSALRSTRALRFKQPPAVAQPRSAPKSDARRRRSEAGEFADFTERAVAPWVLHKRGQGGAATSPHSFQQSRAERSSQLKPERERIASLPYLVAVFVIRTYRNRYNQPKIGNVAGETKWAVPPMDRAKADVYTA
jgi:hypothetical protein